MAQRRRLRRAPTEAPALPESFAGWFARRGWEPRAHQLELLEKARAGRSALLVAPTGAGKTLAGFLPTLIELAGADAIPSPLFSGAPENSAHEEASRVYPTCLRGGVGVGAAKSERDARRSRSNADTGERYP